MTRVLWDKGVWCVRELCVCDSVAWEIQLCTEEIHVEELYAHELRANGSLTCCQTGSC